MTALAKQMPPAVQNEAGAIINMIERAAMDPAVDVEKLRQLLELRNQAEAKAAERDFDAAMTAAQNDMSPVRTDSANTQTKSRYASYPALDRALRPIYTKNGFALSFNTEPASENMVRVMCQVSHRGGHSRKYQIDMPADGKGAKGGDVMTKTHATGSAVSYGMRYLLKMIFNIAVGDDDGNAAADTGERITEEQAFELIDLCEAVGADRARFCKYLKVNSLADLPATRFEDAKQALEAKREKKHG